MYRFPSAFLRSVLKPLFLVIQKIIKFLHQFYKLFMVLFLRDPLAQNVHAFSFVRGHGASGKGTSSPRIIYLERLKVNWGIPSCYVGENTKSGTTV